MRFLQDSTFWKPFALVAVGVGLFFAWELKLVSFPLLPTLPRPEPTSIELGFAVVLTLLLGLNAGLFTWQKKNGTCPIGAKRASGIAGAVGAVALVCPACILIPFTIFGLSISLTFLSPFLPLLQIIALLLLVVSTIMMWPKKA